MKDKQQKQMERFLLGELSAPERDQFEAQLFVDDAFFEQMLATEDDLFDRYVSGELSARESERFKGRLAVTARQQGRLEFAKALKIKVAEAEAQRQATTVQPASRPWWRASFNLTGLRISVLQMASAALAVVLLAGGTWLVSEIVRLRRQAGESQTAQVQPPQEKPEAGERAGNDRSSQELERERQQREQPQPAPNPQPAKTAQSPAIATFVLSPGLLRDEQGIKRLQVAPGLKAVRLRLGLRRDGDYQSFRAELKTIDGSDVLQRDDLKARQTNGGARVVILNLPAQFLKDGAYKILLTGLGEDGVISDVDTYYFNVSRGK